MELTPQNVEQIFKTCLFQKGESTENYVEAEGIRSIMGFHPQRLEENKENILALIEQFPDSFREEGGGGMSFLNMCEDKNGNLWTGMHSIMEQLVALGIAIGKMKYLMPRPMWKTMPGGMPYIVIKTNIEEVEAHGNDT